MNTVNSIRDAYINTLLAASEQTIEEISVGVDRINRLTRELQDINATRRTLGKIQMGDDEIFDYWK